MTNQMDYLAGTVEAQAAEIERLQERVKDLQQFHDWAAPQCQDYAANRQEIERLRSLLRLVQSDPGNWLHPDLQKRIEAAVGESAPYRSVEDPG